MAAARLFRPIVYDGHVDVDPPIRSAFTTYFCKHLRAAQGVVSRAELLERLRASLKHEGYDQVPQLECPGAAKKKRFLE